MEQLSYYIFRYYSNRGTDQKICVALPKGTSKKDVMELAKDWARKSTEGTACHEYTVSIKQIKTPPSKQIWLKKWDKICKQYTKIKEQKENLRVINIPFNWSNRI